MPWFPHALARRVAVLVGAMCLCAVTWRLSPDQSLDLGLIAAIVLLTLRFPVSGMCILCFTVPWSNSVPGVHVGSLSLTDLVVAALAVAWIVSASVERREVLSTRVWTPYILIFLATILISMVGARDVPASLREIVKWTELAVTYLAGAYWLRQRRQIGAVLVALLLAGVSQALLGVGQALLSAGPAAFAEHRIILRAYGTFDQPNPYAGYLNMILPFALALFGLQRGPVRLLSGLATLTLIAALALSQSRGAAIAGAVSFGIVSAFLWPRLKPALWLGTYCGIVAGWLATFGLVPLAPFERFLSAVGLGNVSFTTVNDANFSAVERAAHWLAGVRMFADYPLLGVGIGNYSAAYPRYHPRGWYASLEHAHNYYINIAAEAGILGLAAYLLLVGTALWYSYAAIRRVSDRVCRAAVLGVLGALIATSLHNLFDVLYVHGMVALLGLLMALIPGSLRAVADGATDQLRSRARD